MTVLTQDQIEQLDYQQCKDALKKLNKAHRLDVPVKDLSKEEWDRCDEVVNCLLWLEDRIRGFEDLRVLSLDPNAAVAKPEKKEVDPSKAKRPARRFSMQGVIYDSVRAASEKTGIKLGTLQTYVSRKPDQYFYVD
jgi:hypothetical protein